jgi:hypothetical protein
LLGIVNKSASVDDDDVVVLTIRLMAGIDAIALELGKEYLRIHQIFGAAHRDDVDFILF